MRISRGGGDDLERRLRSERPEPRSEFLASIVDRARVSRRTTFRGRGVLAGGLTAALLVALAITGGLSYAAQSASNGASAAASVASSQTASSSQSSKTSADGGYKPCKSGDISYQDNKGKFHCHKPCKSGGTFYQDDKGKGHCVGPCKDGDTVVTDPKNGKQKCKKPDDSDDGDAPDTEVAVYDPA